MKWVRIRIHIPVVTNSEVEFYLDEERMDLKEGECWYMNFNLLHRVSNNGDADRIHLVIDAGVNDGERYFYGTVCTGEKRMDDPSSYLDPK